MLRVKVAEGREYRYVDGAGVIQEDAYYFLHIFLLSLAEGGVVFFLGILHPLPIVGLEMGVRLMLGPFRRGVIKSNEGVLDVVQHGEVDQHHGAFPIEVDPEVTLAAPIMFNSVEFPQCVHEVFGMLLANILDN